MACTSGIYRLPRVYPKEMTSKQAIIARLGGPRNETAVFIAATGPPYLRNQTKLIPTNSLFHLDGLCSGDEAVSLDFLSAMMAVIA
jgi:hypothetical protein